MADIDIQEKQRSLWPWLIGLLGVVLVVWVVAEMLGDDDQDFATTVPAQEQQYEPTAAGTAAEMPAELEQFTQECGASSQISDDMSRQHEHLQTCVRHMTSALEAVVQQARITDAPFSQQLEQYRERAGQLTSDPSSPEHSAILDEVFDYAAALMARIEEARPDAGQALAGSTERVQQAADAFSAGGQVMEQQEEVASFFREASTALRTMVTGQEEQR